MTGYVREFWIIRARCYATCRLFEAKDRIVVCLGSSNQPGIGNIKLRPMTKRGVTVVVALLNEGEDIAIDIKDMHIPRRKDVFDREIVYPFGKFVSSFQQLIAHFIQNDNLG